MCVCVCVCVCSIGGATGYRVSELTGLTEGSTLIVGGKEVEVQYLTHYTLSVETLTNSVLHWHNYMSRYNFPIKESDLMDLSLAMKVFYNPFCSLYSTNSFFSLLKLPTTSTLSVCYT